MKTSPLLKTNKIILQISALASKKWSNQKIFYQLPTHIHSFFIEMTFI